MLSSELCGKHCHPNVVKFFNKLRKFGQKMKKTKNLIKDNILVMKESISEFKATGCVCSSSPWAAEALIEPLTKAKSPRKIIEVGAGVGPVTVKILDILNPEDTLVICEINSKFMKTLVKRVHAHARYEELKNSITFFEGPIQELPEQNEKFNFIVCALPFLNFEKPLIQEIFYKLVSISSNSCLMTFFEYMAIRNLSKVISPADRKQRMLEIDNFLNEIYSPRKIGVKKVWLNLTPINVYTLNMAA
jgi:phospholipid N-methyltransferase